MNAATLGYKYLGLGVGPFKGMIDIKVGATTTLQECLQLCADRRLADSKKEKKDSTYNGVVWNKKDRYCWLIKNDNVHNSSPDYADFLHFRAE